MVRKRAYLSIIFLSLSFFIFSQWVSGGNPPDAGSISGTVKDPSGAVIPGATVTIHNPVSGYNRSTSTDTSGAFTFTNIPYNSYHLTVVNAGFASYSHDVDVNSLVPINLNVTMDLAGGKTEVTVTTEAADLVQLDSTAHTDVDRELIDRLPLESQTSSLSSLVTLSSPGISADSNGLFHGLGDHASNSFSVDGQPISDQQSKVFSNQLPEDAIQSIQVIEGAPPAEYGDKTSVVIVATTRSGMGVKTPTGSITTSYGTFGTATAGFDMAYGRDKWGNFIAASGMSTSRFLDGPEFVPFHDRGNEENIFDRLDLRPTDKDTLNVNFQFTRSYFQTPNSYDAEDATAWTGLVVNNEGFGPNGLPVGVQDQRSQIKTVDLSPTWTRLINNSTVFTFGGWMRRDGYNYYPSADPFADLTPDLQLQTVGQRRTLTNAGLRSDVAIAKGNHNIKAGIFFQHTFLDENDALGLVDPLSNPVCLEAESGLAVTDPSLTNPADCTGPFQPNPGFNPLLACYDLSRTATLPGSDGCPNSTSGSYDFLGHADIKEVALYGQDNIKVKNWQFNLGVRADFYNGITVANEVEPRLGVAYSIKPTGTILRISYARTMETPFNENLILASDGCNNSVISAIMSSSTPCVTNAPLTPSTRNEYHAGLEQAFGKHLVFDGEYIWKYTRGAYDFSILGNTPITFPIEWAKSKIPGFAARVSVPNTHGFSAYVVMSSVAARFFEPQISGIGATPSGSEVFRIDHDEAFNQTTHIQYQPFKRSPWIGFNWRYDSGMVAGSVPCAGGNCVNGPNGTDTIVDTSMITPDQQFEAGLACNGVYATPTTPISPNDLCPASEYTSKYLRIPAAGTENDDHNPPRIAPRNLFDMTIGDDNLFNGDKRKWSLRLSAVNLTNKEALYNYLSTFSGTHYVTPRALTAELGFHF